MKTFRIFYGRYLGGFWEENSQSLSVVGIKIFGLIWQFLRNINAHILVILWEVFGSFREYFCPLELIFLLRNINENISIIFWEIFGRKVLGGKCTVFVRWD